MNGRSGKDGATVGTAGAAGMGTTVGRRGLIAGAAALAAATLAATHAEKVGAASGGGNQGAVIQGSYPPPGGTTSNTSNVPTWLRDAGGFSLPADSGNALLTVDVNNTSSMLNVNAVNGIGRNTGAGLRGDGGNNAGAGVAGFGGPQGTNTAKGWGVLGVTDGASVPARNNDNDATEATVAGVTGNGFGASTAGVIGRADSRPGVIGRANSGAGVIGVSTSDYGVLGVTTSGSASLAGISTNVNIPAFAGGNAVAGGLAARFNGGVYVDGSFVVANPSLKSGLIRHPDGTHRLVYCVESPESWIEDYGTGTVANGRASVAIDPDFVAMMDTDREYHVFLSDHGHNHLAVTGRAKGSFAVQTDASTLAARGKSAAEVSGTFSYRIVAHPRDNKATRFAKYTPPKPWKVEFPTYNGTDAPTAGSGRFMPPPERGGTSPQPPAAPTAPAAPGNPAPAPPRR